MDKHRQLQEFVKQHPEAIAKVVDYNPSTDRLHKFDFTAANTELSPAVIADTEKFCMWVNNKLSDSNSRYGVGGYMEHRTLYNQIALFDTEDEPRRLHLGIDLWAGAGTPVYAPVSGHIHSFNDNDHWGDYGPTIILKHNLDGLLLYSLYGHLSRADLSGLTEGQPVAMGQKLAAFGNTDENGYWPPHLHFQLIFDMGANRGDYPGACRYSEKKKYMANIPNPNLLLQFPGLDGMT